MTERSQFSTDGAGDYGPSVGAQRTMTLESAERLPELRLPWKPLAGAIDDDDGVFKRHLDEYEASVDGAVIRVAAGRGICDGTIHESDNDVDLTPAVPQTGTTGGMVVLRKHWYLRTVRVALHQNDDGDAAPPALTQEAGLLWEVPLWTYTVTTGGVITLTADARRYLRPVDAETILRSSSEGGAYSMSRLGAFGGPTSLATTSKVGFGWELLLDTGSGVGNSPGNTVVRGGWRLQTGSTSNNDCGVLGPQHARIDQDWFAIFVLAAESVASQSILAGLHATAASFASGNDEVGFRIDGTGEIVAYADNGGAETVLASGVTPDGATRHVLVMSIRDGTKADFWIDGAPVGRIASNLPDDTTDLYGQVGIRTTTSSDRSLYLGEAIFFARV